MFFNLRQSFIDTGDSVHKIKCQFAMNSIAWNPKRHVLAYAGDDVDRYGKDEGALHLFGFRE